jgi:tetratricopeptide (TPR) repeat protein
MNTQNNANQRLQTLLNLLESYPDDPFSLYSVALEYRTTNNEKAAYYFNLLLQNFPDYLPAYYPAAAFFLEIGESDKAIGLWETGIALAKKQGNNKTAQELGAAYEQFLF